MHPVHIDTTIDQAAVAAIPALLPFLGRHVELIALEIEPKSLNSREKEKISLDEYLNSRTKWMADSPPISLDDMEKAIVDGAIKSAGG